MTKAKNSLKDKKKAIVKIGINTNIAGKNNTPANDTIDDNSEMTTEINNKIPNIINTNNSSGKVLRQQANKLDCKTGHNRFSRKK